MTTETNSLDSALDGRLEDAIQAANYQIVLRVQREQLRQRLKQHLTYSINGGTFHITPELVSFVQTLITLGHDESVLLDINQNPVKIEGLEEFLENIVDRYQESHNTYLLEYKKVQRSRSPKALVGV